MPKGTDENYLVIVDELSATICYIGRATRGSSTSAAVWQIRKYTTTGIIATAIAEEWADGSDNFDKVWDDRASLSYS